MRAFLLVLLAALLAPTAVAEAPDTAPFLAALEGVEHEYEEAVVDGVLVEQEAYDEAKDEYLPLAQSRWAALRPAIVAEHAHEAEEIDEALDGIAAKVAAVAPAAEVVALVETIEHEIAEATGAVATDGDFDGAADAFRAKLAEVVAAYAAGDKEAALAEVREAYLDVYGPRLEPLILAVDDEINEKIEGLLNVELVGAIQNDAPLDGVTAIVADIEGEVERAEAARETGRSAGSMLFSSLLIIVREGFEAMLVVGALATYLVRTGHKAKAPLLYWGAAAGIAASVALWFALRAAYASLPIDQEVLEGATALLAVAVLFYVSYWLISKVEVGKWNRFIQGKMKGALARGGSLALVGVAFLAVFREGFETVLFYQGLYAGADGGSGVAVTSGLVLGAFVLAAAALAFYRFGVKLPLRPFFIGTSVLLYYLAFVFTGAGIHELQEAGIVSLTLVAPLASLLALPVFGTLGELLGLYPTVETLVAQGFLLAAVALGLVWTFFVAPRREAGEAPAEA